MGVEKAFNTYGKGRHKLKHGEQASEDNSTGIMCKVVRRKSMCKQICLYHAIQTTNKQTKIVRC